METLKKSKVLRAMGKILLVAVILELTIFQFPSFHLWFGGYDKKTIAPTDMTMTGNGAVNDGDKSITINGKETVSLETTDLGYKIGTVKVNLEFGGNTMRTQLTMDMADETHAEPRYSVASATIVKDAARSQYVSCEFSGNVSDLKLNFTNYNESDSIVIKSIQLNESVPFHVMPIRVLLIVALGTLLYALLCATTLRKPYEDVATICNRCIMIVTVLAVCIASWVIHTKLPEEGLSGQFALETGNQITQELVDAFENGQISLLEEPSQDLLELNNPYDWGERMSTGVNAKWDHVLYEGKYYSYYGIAPVVLVFLPYHMITNHYFPTDIAVYLFSVIGIIFLALAYLTMMKKWFAKIPSGIVLSGMVILMSSCGIWYCIGRTLFYEISISSGFMFMAIAAYCLISSGLLSKEKVSLIRLAISSLCFGLAVLSRPTLAVYSICAVIFYVYYFVENCKASADKKAPLLASASAKVQFILSAAAPIAICALAQMWYNHARFGSILDFGIEYSLTINDFTHDAFYLIFVFIGLFNYLFAVPGISVDYPYVKTPFTTLGANGYYFHDLGNTSGILFLALPTFGYVFSRKALRLLPDRKERIRYATMIGLPCVVMPLVIICSIWESGYAVRYVADFSWEMVIGAFAILFFLYLHSENAYKKNLFVKFMAVSAILAVIINGVQIFDFTFPEETYPEVSRMLRDIVTFWR